MWIETLNEYSTPNRIGAGSRIAPTPYGFVCQRGKYQTRFYSNRKPDLGQNNSAAWKPILTKVRVRVIWQNRPYQIQPLLPGPATAPYISNLSLGFSLFTFPVNEISMNHSLPAPTSNLKAFAGMTIKHRKFLVLGGVSLHPYRKGVRKVFVLISYQS